MRNFLYSLKSLLELLEDKIPIGDNISLVIGAIQCLCDLSEHLCARLMSVSDPVLFCPDQGLYALRRRNERANKYLYTGLFYVSTIAGHKSFKNES